MAKYNLRVKQEKPAIYRMAVKPEVIDEIYEQILKKMIVEKKFRDPKFTAQKLAEEIGTNTRYISAAVSLRFQQNYSALVARMRLYEAKYMLQDRSFDNLTVEDIATKVGFTTRQSFYASFYRFIGVTPRQYRLDNMKKQKS